MTKPVSNLTKFRPYLTIPELKTILSSLKTTNPSADLLIKNLESVLYKAESGISSPSYQPNPRPSIDDKLGFSDTPKLAVSLEESRLQAYHKWVQNPASCSPAELARVQMYRYEHDLMTESEERDYETSHGLV